MSCYCGKTRKPRILVSIFWKIFRNEFALRHKNMLLRAQFSVRRDIYVYIYTHIYIHACIYTYMYSHIYIYMYNIYICTWLFKYVSMYVYLMCIWSQKSGTYERGLSSSSYAWDHQSGCTSHESEVLSDGPWLVSPPKRKCYGRWFSFLDNGHWHFSMLSLSRSVVLLFFSETIHGSLASGGWSKVDWVDGSIGSPLQRGKHGTPKFGVPGLVNLQKTMENHHFIAGNIHYKWP